MAKVRDIMKGPVPALKKEATVAHAAKLLLRGPSDFAVITDKDGHLLGVVSLHDFLEHILTKRKGTTKVMDVMSTPAIALNANLPVDEALKVIDTERLRKYPVVENNKQVGSITDKEIVNSVSKNIKFHRNIQNIVLVLFMVFELFMFIIYPRAFA